MSAHPPAPNHPLLISRVRGVPLGTWLVPVVMSVCLGLFFVLLGFTDEHNGATALVIGIAFVVVPLLGVAAQMVKRCVVEVCTSGVRVLTAPRLEVGWEQIAAVSTIMTMDAARETLALTLCPEGIRAQPRRGGRIRPTYRIKVTKEVADAIKLLWGEQRTQGEERTDAVDCYIERQFSAPAMLVYLAWCIARFVFTQWLALGITACAALLALAWWTALRDRRVTHIEADATGLKLVGRLGYAISWDQVQSLVTAPIALSAADRVTLQLSAEAKRRIGWRRFLDGVNFVTIHVPRGLGAVLVSLWERSRQAEQPTTPTSGAR